jgi:hypothetical protein
MRRQAPFYLSLWFRILADPIRKCRINPVNLKKGLTATGVPVKSFGASAAGSAAGGRRADFPGFSAAFRPALSIS